MWAGALWASAIGQVIRCVVGRKVTDVNLHRESLLFSLLKFWRKRIHDVAFIVLEERLDSVCAGDGGNLPCTGGISPSCITILMQI